MTELPGGCHCRSVRYQLEWPVSTASLSDGIRINIPGRQCSCTYCTRFKGVWTSHSDARLIFEPGARNQLAPYRFGTMSAAFMFCQTCGVVIAAIAKIDHVDRAVLNVRTLDQPEQGDPSFVVQESEGCFDDEDLEQRTDRRRDRWIRQVNWRDTAAD